MRLPSPCSSITSNPTILRASWFGASPAFLHRINRLIQPFPLRTDAGDGVKQGRPVKLIVGAVVVEDTERESETRVNVGREILVGGGVGMIGGTGTGTGGGISGENTEIEIQHWIRSVFVTGGRNRSGLSPENGCFTETEKDYLARLSWLLCSAL